METVPRFEIERPDIRPLRGNPGGIDHVTVLDSGQPGPHVVINALGHGNELCGALALIRLLGVRPKRGRLTLVLANVEAFRRFDPARPQASRYVDEDFNRLWSDAILDGGGDSSELRRARQLRPLYCQADALLDLHSMTGLGEPLILCGRTGRARALALALGVPRWVVADSGHAGGRRLIDFEHFAGPDRPGAPVALLVECGQHGQARSAELAFAISLLFLKQFQMIEPETVARLLPKLEPTPQSAPQQVVDVTAVVTASGDDFVFCANFGGLEVVPRAGTVIGTDQGRPVRTPHDNCILIMPTHKARRGQTVVRLGRILAP